MLPPIQIIMWGHNDSSQKIAQHFHNKLPTCRSNILKIYHSLHRDGNHRTLQIPRQSSAHSRVPTDPVVPAWASSWWAAVLDPTSAPAVWPAARCGAHRWLPLGRAWGPVGETHWKVEGLGIGIIVFFHLMSRHKWKLSLIFYTCKWECWHMVMTILSCFAWIFWKMERLI